MSSTLQGLAHPLRKIGTRPAAPKRGFRLSAAVAAIAVFVATGITAALVIIFGYQWWLESALPSRPDVVLVGSSVIAEPLVYYEYPGNLPLTFLDQHPIVRAPRLESLLSAQGDISAFNCAAIDQGIFETVRYFDTALRFQKQPHVAALFISPVTMCAADRSQQIPASRVGKIIARAKFEVGKLADMAVLVRRKMKIIAHILANKSTRDINDEARKKRWAEFDAVYAAEYKSGLRDDEFKAISRFLDLCQGHSIKPLIVSTPLAPENRALLRAFTYKEYSQRVAQVCRNRCDFVDLGEASDFQAPNDFLDGAHCNGNGAKKIYKDIAPYLVQLCRRN